MMKSKLPGDMRFSISFNKEQYKPLEEVAIECQWDFHSEAPYCVEIMLVYYSIQKKSSTPQKEFKVQQHTIWGTPVKGDKKFIFQLPDFPYSFKGKIFDIRYAIKVKFDKVEFYEDFTCTPFD